MTVAVCITIIFKRETKFRESSIALICWVELGAWLAAIVYFSGLGQILMGVALGLHVLTNGCFVMVHEKLIFPRGDAYYQEVVMTEHKKHARCVMLSSFLFTFKFQHILLSNLAEKERYAGDFTDECWRVWNKFALVYILLIYPVAVTGAIFSILDPSSPVAGYMAIEVIIVSTYITILLLMPIFQHFIEFGPCGPICKRIKCCKCDSNRKATKRVSPKAKKGDDYDKFGPDDSGMDLVKKKVQESEESKSKQKDSLYNEDEKFLKEGYAIKVTRRESEEIEHDSDGNELTDQRMVERMKKERTRLKMLKEQMTSEKKLL
jgi:hypothetical protein